MYSYQEPGNQNKGTILIVDDTVENLEVLDDLLTSQGYEVRRAINGKMALMGIEAELPDIILLDIMMPDMNGYEVCTHLKSDPNMAGIPIIFISAIDDVFDKVKAFRLGAVDYIPKPFQSEEVLVRLENQLRVLRLQRELQQTIEERRERLNMVRDSEKKFKESIDNAPIGIFQSSCEGRYIKVNQALAETYGFMSPNDLLSAYIGVEELHYVDDNYWKNLTKAIANKGCVKNVKTQVYNADGDPVWILESVRAIKGEEGQILYYEGFVNALGPVK